MGVAAQAVAQPLLLDDQAGAQLLDAPGRANGPTVVAEPALELARDGGVREGGEAGTGAGAVAVHRLDERGARHLDEVVGLDAPLPA